MLFTTLFTSSRVQILKTIPRTLFIVKIMYTMSKLKIIGNRLYWRVGIVFKSVEKLEDSKHHVTVEKSTVEIFLSPKFDG